MAIIYLAGNRIEGLAADTKPVTVVTNSEFYETDTKDIYIFNGSAWVISNVGSSITGGEIANATIPIAKLANGTANKTIGFDANGVITELTSATGVDPITTAEVYPISTLTDEDYSRPLWVEFGLNPDPSITIPLDKLDFTGSGKRLTYEEDFKTGGLTWLNSGNNAFISAAALNLHTDFQSASTLDLWAIIGTAQNPIPISTNSWTLRWSMEWTEKATVITSTGYMLFGLSSRPADTHKATDAQSFCGVTIAGHNTTASAANYHGGTYGSEAPHSSAYVNNNPINFHDLFHYEMMRNGDRIWFRVYSDSDYKHMSYETFIDAANNRYNNETFSAGQNSQALRYLKVMGYSTDTTLRNLIRGKVDNIKFWNNCLFADDHDVLNAIEPIQKHRKNYLGRNKPRWDNDEECFIGQVKETPYGWNQINLRTTITALNKWRKAWLTDTKFTSLYPIDPFDTVTNEVHTGYISGQGLTWGFNTSNYAINAHSQFDAATGSLDGVSNPSPNSFPISERIYASGFRIDSTEHPLIVNSANRGWSYNIQDNSYSETNERSNIAYTKGEGSYGLPVQTISFYATKIGSPTGKLVCRVFNGGDTTQTYPTSMRGQSVDTVEAASISNNPLTPTKITFNMNGWQPRLYDFCMVEFEKTYKFNNESQDGTTQFPRPRRLNDGTLAVFRDYSGQYANDSNKIQLRYQKMTYDNLEQGAIASNNARNTNFDNKWHCVWEATLEQALNTASTTNPYIDVWVGYPWFGKKEYEASGERRLWKDTRDGDFIVDEYANVLNGDSLNTIGADSIPRNFYQKFWAAGVTPNIQIDDFRQTSAPQSFTNTKHSKHTYSDPPSKIIDFKHIRHRFIQFRVGTSSDNNSVPSTTTGNSYEIWVSNMNIGQPRKFGATFKDNLLNDWRRIGWGTASYESYLYAHDIFRYCQFIINTHAYNASTTTQFYYAHDQMQNQQAVVAIGIQLGTSNTETQICIQESDRDLAENHINKWRTVRTVDTSLLSTTEISKILVPISLTNKYRIKGNSNTAGKRISIKQLKICYVDKEEVKARHGHVQLDSSNGSLALSG